jgi:aspartyl-tRNA(Asn)/glutamyl-tRNA(Gln) amidotransferase subunit B
MTMVQGGISDCDMEKGQLRCDANISIRPIGQTKLGVKVELKNLNSISYVRDGIAF